MRLRGFYALRSVLKNNGAMVREFVFDIPSVIFPYIF